MWILCVTTQFLWVEEYYETPSTIICRANINFLLNFNIATAYKNILFWGTFKVLSRKFSTQSGVQTRMEIGDN